MIDPRGLDVVEWTDRMAAILPFPVVRLFDPDEWRAWAYNLIKYPIVSQLSPPDPNLFEDWMEWAERFNEITGLQL